MKTLKEMGIEITYITKHSVKQVVYAYVDKKGKEHLCCSKEYAIKLFEDDF